VGREVRRRTKRDDEKDGDELIFVGRELIGGGEEGFWPEKKKILGKAVLLYDYACLVESLWGGGGRGWES